MKSPKQSNSIEGLAGLLDWYLAENTRKDTEKSILLEYVESLLKAEREGLIKAKDAAYRERDQLVLALSKLWSSHLTLHPKTDKTWDYDWRWIVCIHSPVGQLTWHIHKAEKPLFKHLKNKTKNHWDGHTTEEKYKRLEELEKSND